MTLSTIFCGSSPKLFCVKVSAAGAVIDIAPVDAESVTASPVRMPIASCGVSSGF